MIKKLSFLFLCLYFFCLGSHAQNPLAGIADGEVASALKEALNVGIDKTVTNLIKTDGYFKDKFIKILLPDEVVKVEKIIRKMPGGTKMADDLILKMNRAAEDAANEAKPIFINAITSITFADAKNILLGNNGAATAYLKEKTFQGLMTAYAPKINASLDKAGALQAWNLLSNSYNNFLKSPAGRFTKDAKPVNPDLGAHVTQKALDGMFFKVTEEEKQIRQNVSARVSDPLKKIFGLLDRKK